MKAYAAAVNALNAKSDAQAAAYNTQLKAQSTSLAQSYNSSESVAEQNIQSSLHMKGSSVQLLHMSGAQMYDQNKVVAQHMSTVLPGST